MARRPTLRTCVRLALKTYRRLLKLAEKGKWEQAVWESWSSTANCLFCQRHPGCKFIHGEGPRIRECEARHICARRPYDNAAQVLYGDRTVAAGVRHDRRTIKQLEALMPE